MPRTLNLNRDHHADWLIGLEFGWVDDGHPEDAIHPICDSFAYYLDEPEGADVGFKAIGLSALDLDSTILAPIWDGTRFHVPVLGLSEASAGEILIAARSYYRFRGSYNRDFFNVANDVRPQQALPLWKRCLECGDGKAHFALGYTYLELGQAHDAYRHLRYYTEIAPYGSWNWCWYGKAALAVGEAEEARQAFLRAIDLTADGDHDTDASARLTELETNRRAER